MPDGRVLRFVATPDDLETPAPEAGERVVVLDTAWTPPRAGAVVGVRDAVAEVLARRNLYAEGATLLDAWAEASGIVDLLTVEGTSLWYQARLGHWWWLQDRLLWLGVVEALLAAERPAEIACGPGMDGGLEAAVRLVAAREGIATRFEGAPATDAGDEPAGAQVDAGSRESAAPARPGLARRLVRRMVRLARPEERERRRREMRGRLAPPGRGRPRLLVLSEHARQRVGGATGRDINPFLDPILDHLPEAGFDWLILEPRSSSADDATWERARARRDRRLVTGDLLRTFDLPGESEADEAAAATVADAIAALRTPLLVSGVDLGPDLVARLVAAARGSLGRRRRNITRQRRLIAEVRPAALVLADEYQRQEWLAAARLEGVPTVAIQHGAMQRWHLGYIHTSRPASLTLVDRTYVFGQWERRLLLTESVYRDDEVQVGGSPRLDLVPAPAPADRASVRAELGIAPGDRLVVLSTTWGDLLRRFHFAVAIARLVDRPLPGIHLVVKLHPSEPDDGLYRRLIEGVSAAGGHGPPALSVVKAIDLYRLLAAADAHVGLYSTVLTEAVVTGTPNLIVAGVEPFDLLGYVPAGVAAAIRDGGDLLEALETGAGISTPEARRAFLDDHFEPGPAGPRIAADLAHWLAGRPPAGQWSA